MPTKITTTFQPIAPQADRRIRKAAAVALTRTAYQVQSALVRGMQEDFDRPTPFTLRAFRVDMANAATLEATVWAMPLQARYLAIQIEGGDRNTKGFEKRMHLFGGEVALPGAGAKLNQYGNMPLSFIKRVAGDQNSNGTAKRFFVGTPKGQPGAPEGVWARVNDNNRIVPMMVFADDAQYQERFNMSAIAEQEVTATFESQLARAMAQFAAGPKG